LGIKYFIFINDMFTQWGWAERKNYKRYSKSHLKENSDET